MQKSYFAGGFRPTWKLDKWLDLVYGLRGNFTEHSAGVGIGNTWTWDGESRFYRTGTTGNLNLTTLVLPTASSTSTDNSATTSTDL